MDAAAENRRSPVSEHQPIRFSPSVDDEQANAGRHGRSYLAKPNSQARTVIGKKSFFPVNLTTGRIGNHIQWIYTPLKVPLIYTHAYIPWTIFWGGRGSLF